MRTTDTHLEGKTVISVRHIRKDEYLVLLFMKKQLLTYSMDKRTFLNCVDIDLSSERLYTDSPLTIAPGLYFRS